MYEQLNLDVYSDENYEFDVCGIPVPPWDPHINPAVPQNVCLSYLSIDFY